MSWRPALPDPPHRLDRHAFRAGELRSPDGADTGHVLVLPMVFWAQVGGHLWWRRWGDPRTTADVWIVAGAVDRSYRLGWFGDDDVLGDMLDLWDAGQVVVAVGRLYEVRWLDPQESVEVARDVFGVDLARERARRT